MPNPRRIAPTATLLAALFVSAAGCAPGVVSEQADAGSGPRTITVPADQPTIQRAVDAAASGDLVLVSPGVYREQVSITAPGITLRGERRDDVIIDGEVRRANGIVVTAPGVTVQNLTVRNATQNGVLVTGLRDETGAGIGNQQGYGQVDDDAIDLLDGFRVDHVTATNNGLYGIYAFHSRNGLIADSFASGGADSGIYVGQCQPCSTVVQANVAEANAVGFEIANAGGDLFVVGNRFSGNRVGATINSDYQEAFVPQTGATFAGNVVAANAEPASPAQADGGWGIGIGVAGGTENRISANLVAANPVVGLELTGAEDLGPIDNSIIGNVFVANGIDTASTSSRAPGSGNCWASNTLTSSVPADVQAVAPCPGGAALTAGVLDRLPAPPGLPFTQVQAPPAQPSLDAASPHRAWRRSDVPSVELDRIEVPTADLLAGRSRTTW